MPTSWLRTAFALALALLASAVFALLDHMPLPGAVEGSPTFAALLSYLKPIVIFGWPAAVVAILLAPRLGLFTSLLYWIFAGLLIGAAGLLFLKKGELAAFRDHAALFQLAKFAAAGALGGLVYWLFAGRSAAAGDTERGSAFGLGNLAAAALIGLVPPLLANFSHGELPQTVKLETAAPAPAPVPAPAQPAPSPAAQPAEDTAKQKSAEEKRLADEAAKKKADEDKRLADEAAKNKADEEKRLADEAAKKKADEEKRLAEEAAKKKADEEKRLAEEAAKKKALEEKRLAEEAAKKKALEEKRLADEAAKKKREDDARLADAAVARKKDDDKHSAEEAAKTAHQAQCAADLKLLLSAKLITFGMNSAALNRETAGFLTRVAEKLKPCADFRLVVGGYSDTSGSPDRNAELSAARAEAVKTALVAGGVAADRISARGYSSTLPQAGGDEARAETPGRKAVIAAMDTRTPGAQPVIGASETALAPQAVACSADAGKLLLSETLYFGSGSPLVKGSQRRALKQLAQFAKRCDNVRLVVTGHTDNVGSNEANDALSNTRAERVAGLLTRLGAPKNRIVTNGLGSLRPADTNDTPEGRARNRRVVIGFEPA